MNGKEYRKLKIKKAENRDYFNTLCYESEKRFRELPEPLKWIEPSVNMLYLNAISSFVFGNYFSSIISMGILLEHVLRLAIFDRENTGLQRELSIPKLEKTGRTLSKLIEKGKREGIIENDDINWWKQVANILRNKSAHYMLPTILQEFTKKENGDEQLPKEKYHPSYYKFTEKNGSPSNPLLHDWGSFFHKSDYFVCKNFIVDSTVQIKKIISKTNWKPDGSWWESQETVYNWFFDFKWNYENMKKSLESL